MAEARDEREEEVGEGCDARRKFPHRVFHFAPAQNTWAKIEQIGQKDVS